MINWNVGIETKNEGRKGFVLGESPSPRKTPMLDRLSGHWMAGQDEVALQLLGILQWVRTRQVITSSMTLRQRTSRSPRRYLLEICQSLEGLCKIYEEHLKRLKVDVEVRAKSVSESSYPLWVSTWYTRMSAPRGGSSKTEFKL